MARAPAKPAAAKPARRKPAASRTPKPAAPPEPQPRPRRRLSLPSLDTGATLLRKVILNIVFVLAVVLFVAILIGQFLYDQVIIEPIAVPKVLIAEGITPEVAASRLWDGLRDAQLQARSSKASLSAIPDSQRIQFAVPDVGLSLDSIVRQTRQFFNLHQTRIGGEITCKTAECTPGEMRLRLRILKSTNEVIDLPPMNGADQRGYFTNAAVQVLSVVDPFIALSAIADSQPVRATTLARRLIRQKHPDAKWAHNLLGNIHTNDKEFTRALAEYRAALALDPDFLIARMNLAKSLWETGQIDASQELYDALYAEHPDNAQIVEGLAELRYQRQDFDGASALLEDAAKLDPASPHYFARIGQIEDERGNGDVALTWFKRSLEIDPAYALALEPTFIHLAGSANFVGAEELLAAAARYAPADGQVQGLHAIALAFLGRTAEALDAYERGLITEPNDFDMLYESAKMLIENNRVADAVARLTHAIEIDPYAASARLERGKAYAYLGENDLSRTDLERVLELDTSGTLYGDLAKTFLAILDAKDAEAAEAQP